MNVDLQTSEGATDLATTAQIFDGENEDQPSAQDQAVNHARWAKLPKPRGRPPKDPHAQIVRFSCRDIGDQENHLREYLKTPAVSAEHTTVEFVYPVSSAFMVYSGDLRPTRNKQQDEKSLHLYGKLDRSAVSIIDALVQTEDPKEQMRTQRAIAKVCVEACEKADGFRYSFHNNWLSREDEACRFSYFCNDSTLNKGRAANEGVGMGNKKMRKPVYDCQGTIAVKFSQTKQSLEVHYKHIPLHQTYAERAPPPRKHSKRYRLMEVFEPEKLPAVSVKRSRSQPLSGSPVIKPSSKRKAATAPSGVEAEADRFNLLETEVTNENCHSTAQQSGADPRSSVPADQIAQIQAHTTLTSADVPQARSTTSAQRYDAPTTSQNALATPNATKSRDRGLKWVESPSQPTSAEAPLRGIVAAAAAEAAGVGLSPLQSIPDPPASAVPGVSQTSATPMSEFEALKAKLEAAEQRIKKLEAEKQAGVAPGQPPMWPPYMPPFMGPPALTPPGPPQSSYPYQYPTSQYHFPPQIMLPPGVRPPSATSQLPYISQNPSMAQQTRPEYQKPSGPSTIATAGEGDNSNRNGRGGQAKSQKFKAFVAYTPKPQRPILNTQKQDTTRKRQDTGG